MIPQAFRDLCESHDIEPVIAEDTLLLICPRFPDTKVREQITGILDKLEGSKYKFVEGLKSYTLNNLNTILTAVGGMKRPPVLKDHRLTIEFFGGLSTLAEENPVWETFQSVLSQDQYLDGYKVIVGDRVILDYDRHVAKILEARPQIKRGILKDDILNLRIQLEATNSVDEFINSL